MQVSHLSEIYTAYTILHYSYIVHCRQESTYDVFCNFCLLNNICIKVKHNQIGVVYLQPVNFVLGTLCRDVVDKAA